MPRAWVLGAKGFIGQHLVRHLNQQEIAVAGLGHGQWTADDARSTGLNHWIDGDISADNLTRLHQACGAADVIYHVAGGSSVGASIADPHADFRRTVASMAELLEWARQYSPQSRIIGVSSAAVYGDSGAALLHETGEYTPFSPYGYHKRAMEYLCESYARNFGLSVSIVRLFSIYGPGLHKQLLWDMCTRLAARPAEITVHGTGTELRDWLHISDAVQILTAAGTHDGAAFTVVNGGTGIGTPLAKIIAMLCDAWEIAPHVKFSGERRSGDPVNLVANTTLLQSQLGCVATTTLRNGIDEYVRWYQSITA